MATEKLAAAQAKARGLAVAAVIQAEAAAAVTAWVSDHAQAHLDPVGQVGRLAQARGALLAAVKAVEQAQAAELEAGKELAAVQEQAQAQAAAAEAAALAQE